MNTRSGPYPRNAVSKNKRGPVKIQSKNLPKHRVTIEEVEMGDPMLETEPITEPVRAEKVPKAPKRRLLPAPIEQLTEFNVSTYLQNLPCGLSVGQAAHAIPKYRSGLARAVRHSRERATDETKEANLVESDDEPTSAAKCTLRIGQKAQTAIIDSGAATSIMTKALAEKLGYNMNRSSKMVVVTANGARTRSLGIIDNVPVKIGKINVLTSF